MLQIGIGSGSTVGRNGYHLWAWAGRYMHGALKATLAGGETHSGDSRSKQCNLIFIGSLGEKKKKQKDRTKQKCLCVRVVVVVVHASEQLLVRSVRLGSRRGRPIHQRVEAMPCTPFTLPCFVSIWFVPGCCGVLTQLRGWSHAQTTTQPNPLPTRAHLSAHGPQGPS